MRKHLFLAVLFAANAALGLMEPMSCGIGGDLFAIVWDAKTQKLYGLNANGAAPLKATRKLFAFSIVYLFALFATLLLEVVVRAVAPLIGFGVG